MTPEEFLTDWREVATRDNKEHHFNTVPSAELENTKLSAEARSFLAAGIPEDGGSYTFDLLPSLKRVDESFARGSWSDAQKQAVEPYIALGEDGGGNVICIHETEGGIWLLDHEHFYQKREFINSSLRQLLEFSLLQFKAWVGDVDYRDLLEPMQKIDPVAMQPEHTWHQVLMEQIEEFEE